MRPVTWLAAAAAAVLAPGLAHAAAPEVEIRDAVARVTVVAEPRADVLVEVVRPNARLPITVKLQGRRTLIDGGLARRIRVCRGGERPSVRVGGAGEVGWAEMPQIVIRTPRDVRLGVGGAVFGTVGRSASLDLSNAGCGDWTVGNVDGALRLTEAGSGDVRVGSAGEATLRIAGSGDIQTAGVRGPLRVDIAGSGDVRTTSVTGPVEVSIAGSGGVKVASGRAPVLTATIGGSGDVVFQGVVHELRARIAGSGDVRVRQVTGPVKKTVLGSGEVITD